MYKRGLGKKGQLVIFVIIAIIIIAVVLLLLILRSGLAPEITEPTGAVSPQIEPIRTFLEECVEKTSYAALEHLGLHAGYANFEVSGLKSIDLGGEKVVVAQKLNGDMINRLPNEQQIESEFGKYLDSEGYDAIDNCVDDFSSFKGQFNIRQDVGERVISAEVREEEVIIKTVWPITVGRGASAVSVRSKDVRILIPLGRILRVSNDIVNQEVSGIAFEGEEIDLYFNSLPSRLKNLKLEPQHYPTHQQDIFMFTTVPYRPGELPYRFYFAVDRE